MGIDLNQGDVVFDDTATLAMGTAFDQACNSLPPFACSKATVRELIAKRIIKAATYGERDAKQLQALALMGFGPAETPEPPVRRARVLPRPAYVLARTA